MYVLMLDASYLPFIYTYLSSILIILSFFAAFIADFSHLIEGDQVVLLVASKSG